jgi:hypothetical protein
VSGTVQHLPITIPLILDRLLAMTLERLVEERCLGLPEGFYIATPEHFVSNYGFTTEEPFPTSRQRLFWNLQLRSPFWPPFFQRRTRSAFAGTHFSPSACSVTDLASCKTPAIITFSSHPADTLTRGCVRYMVRSS